MSLMELAASVGITVKLPEEMLAFAENYRDDGKPACDLAVVEALQQEFNLFGVFIEPIMRAGECINQDKTLSDWVKVSSQYAMQATFTEARRVPVPPADGTETMDFLPLFMLLPQIPLSIAQYRERGFPEEELADLLMGYQGGINIVRNQTGRPGVNQTYFNWFIHYTKAILFKTHTLQFEKVTLPGGTYWLKHQETGEIIPLKHGATMCGDGKHVFGTAGFTECEETFQVLFEEDEENYYGYPTYNCVVSAKRETYPKAKWECVARPGDECLNMHIPKGADISRENMQAACQKALEIVAQRYPECKGRMIYCASWLLDPTLAELLGESSKITSFQQGFTRYPTKDSGTAVFSFAFTRRPEDLRDLPEDTSLQRKIKAHCLNGGYIYSYSGIYTG